MRTFFNTLAGFLGGVVITLIFSAIAPGIGTIIGIFITILATAGGIDASHKQAEQRAAQQSLRAAQQALRAERPTPPAPPVNERGLTRAQELNP